MYDIARLTGIAFPTAVELAEMLDNNGSVRAVLNDLAKDLSTPR